AGHDAVAFHSPSFGLGDRGHSPDDVARGDHLTLARTLVQVAASSSDACLNAAFVISQSAAPAASSLDSASLALVQALFKSSNAAFWASLDSALALSPN